MPSLGFPALTPSRQGIRPETSVDDLQVVPATQGQRPHRFTVQKPVTSISRGRRQAPGPSVDVDHVFRHVFGQREYRGAQREIMQAAVQGIDLLVLAPTGLGKSLCFQVPALAEAHGITIVVSPLLALMRDQIAKLRELGVSAAALTSNSTLQDRARIIRDLRAGHPQLRLLYISAERLSDNNFLKALKRTYANNELARLVVDEAHVITTWGETFRPDYRKLGRFRDYFPKAPIMALTASATTSTADEIVASLHMDPEVPHPAPWPSFLRLTAAQHTWRVSHGVDRPNLFYELRYDRDDRVERCERIATLLKRTYEERTANSGPSVSGLIYCRSRNAVEDVASYLRSQGFHAAPYHRGLDAQLLQNTADRWQHAADLAARYQPYVDVLCATVAFGMGIDKNNVRYIIHYDLPTSFEGYYQEIGRAGRDGQPSRCLLFYSREDGVRAKGLVARSIAQQKLGIDAPAAIQATASVRERQCAHRALVARFFGEDLDGTRDGQCRNVMCDICSQPQRVKERFQADLTPCADDDQSAYGGTPWAVERTRTPIEEGQRPAKKRRLVNERDAEAGSGMRTKDRPAVAHPALPPRDVRIFPTKKLGRSEKPSSSVYDDPEGDWEVAGGPNPTRDGGPYLPASGKDPPGHSTSRHPSRRPVRPSLSPAPSSQQLFHDPFLIPRPSEPFYSPPPSRLPALETFRFKPPTRSATANSDHRESAGTGATARRRLRSRDDRPQAPLPVVQSPVAEVTRISASVPFRFKPPAKASSALQPFPRGRAVVKSQPEVVAKPRAPLSQAQEPSLADLQPLPPAIAAIEVVVDPVKYQKPIPLEDREKAIKALARRLALALLAAHGERSKDEQAVIFTVLGLTGSTAAAKHQYIVDAATSCESQTHQGYIDLLSRRKVAFEALSTRTDWFMHDRPKLERDIGEVVTLLKTQATRMCPASSSSSPVKKRSRSFAMSQVEEDSD